MQEGFRFRHVRGEKGQNGYPLELSRRLLSDRPKGSGPENYKDNIFADTFRCPQYLTFNLGNPPSSTQLSAYIHNKALLGRNSSTIELPPGNRYQGPTGHVKSRIVRSRDNSPKPYG